MVYIYVFVKLKLTQYDFLKFKIREILIILFFDTRCNSNCVQILGSIGSVAGGLIVGKEGPLVHVGACIASILGQGGSVRYGMTWKWLRYLKNDRDRRDLVTCGAAAGVAAAFRAPVGGVLFALEEVTSWYEY
jgi:H+/Cl- antiporter ClcA